MPIESRLHPDMPVVFAANHLFSPCLHRPLIEINKQFKEKNILFLCDAAYSWALACYGLDTIKLDTSKKTKNIKGPVERAKLMITISFGKAIGAYKNSVSGPIATEMMTEALKGGRDVFMFPEGRSGDNLPWYEGIGKIVKSVGPEKTALGFVYIRPKARPNIKILFTDAVDKVIPIHPILEPSALAATLQYEYNMRKF